jgi:hypothetical protein
VRRRRWRWNNWWQQQRHRLYAWHGFWNFIYDDDRRIFRNHEWRLGHAAPVDVPRPNHAFDVDIIACLALLPLIAREPCQVVPSLEGALYDE